MAEPTTTAGTDQTEVTSAVDIWLTLSEAADKFDVSRSTLRRRLDDDEIPQAQQTSDGRGTWQLPHSWLAGQYEQRDIVLDTAQSATTTSVSDDIVEMLRSEITRSFEDRLVGVERERDRIESELKRARSDLEAEEIERRRAHDELGASQAVVIDLTAKIGTVEARAAEEAARAAERADRIDRLEAATAEQAEQIEALRIDLAEARANARWSYRRKLRTLP